MDEIRRVAPLFPCGASPPASPKQLWFTTVEHDTFADLNRLWHSRLPKIGASRGRVYYGAEFDGLWYAVAMWSNPVARLLPQLTWMELRRFAIADDAPPHSASRMLGWMTRDVHKRFPDVERLISYQDLDAHEGTIYKASGWTQAENYVSRKRGWKATTGWASRHRVGRTDQAVAPRMRWEKKLTK